MDTQKFTSMYPDRTWGVHVAFLLIPPDWEHYHVPRHINLLLSKSEGTLFVVFWTVSTKYMYYGLSLSLFAFLPSLLSLLSKFDILEQLGFEGYAIMVNTGELQTHLLATSKGKNYHKMKQQSGKPLENPFIGYVFSEESGTITC